MSIYFPPNQDQDYRSQRLINYKGLRSILYQLITPQATESAVTPDINYNKVKFVENSVTSSKLPKSLYTVNVR